jgi:hypothetical protein
MYQCVCIDHDAEPKSGTYSSAVVKGRKDHHCCECGRAIPKGTPHEVDKGIWDGSWRSYRTCMICRQIRKDFMECSWIYGQLWEDLREALMDGEDYDEEDETGSCWLTPPI